jgi:MobA-like NTP transferase protein
MAALPSGPRARPVPGTPVPPDFDAVILAGGRASRLGGADKPGLVIGSMTMAAAVTSAVAAAGARKVVLVGPPRPELSELTATLPGRLTVTRENPPGGGPVPALRAGLAEVTAPWVAVLAADLPFLRAADVRELLAAAAQGPRSGPAQPPGGPPRQAADGRDTGVPPADAGPAGAVLADDQDAAQWLAGCWRTSRLRAALAGYPGASLHGVLAPLAPALVRLARDGAEAPPWLDCDTPAAVEAARIAAHQTGAHHPGAHQPGRTSDPEQKEAAP